MLRVYNTLTRTKEEFQPVVPGKVGMYLCGPTVYKPSHIGHMVGPTIFDTIKRYLTYCGYQTTFVVNITDVDDKLINESNARGIAMSALADEMTADYKSNLAALGVDSIDVFPKATDYIGKIIEFTSDLIEKGFAYESDGDVYFDVAKFPEYGKLSNRTLEQMLGEGGSTADRKRSGADFALWKSAKPGEPSWDSPWGKGRPGWHIECSVMSCSLLGETFDIHGGGLDLQFPHHENEIAQSEARNGCLLAKYWMHNGLMQASNEVGKGLDGFYRYFKRFEAATGLSFYDLTAPATRVEGDAFQEKFAKECANYSEFVEQIKGLRDRFLEAMDDDFNTGGGIGVFFDYLRALNKSSEATLALKNATIVFKELALTLGLFRKPVEIEEKQDDSLVEPLMNLLIDLRRNAKKNKDFATADEIRNRLKELGVTLEDRPGGVCVWTRE